jgi:RimJ/RimL family protein N-acetyltransferase
MLSVARSFIEQCVSAMEVDSVLWDSEVANVRSTRLAERLGFALKETRFIPSRFDDGAEVEKAFYGLSIGGV